MKKIGVMLVFIMLAFGSGFVIAEEFENCDEECTNFFSVSMPACENAGKIIEGEYPDCVCEWDCESANVLDVDDKGRELEDEEKCMARCMMDIGLIPGQDCGPGTDNKLGCAGCVEECEMWKVDTTQYEEIFDDVRKEYVEEDVVNPGITPDSIFYFLDGISESREEKIAEVEAMIAQSDFDSARKALLKYKEHAEKFIDDPDPEKRDESRRAAASIHRMLEKIKENVPEDDREEFYEDVLDTEGGIVTAVEISFKIKDLCVQLAELDPEKYHEVCRSDDDSSDWQKKLDKDLTKEQREEAKKFGKIMSRCFKTSGQDCACEDISFYDFSLACEKAAPLAIACDVEGDETACDELDNLDMPGLPDYLQDVMDDLEEQYSEGKYGMHMPSECVEAGVKTPKECGKIMIKEHSPIECRSALLESGCERESECREICDKIMFELHSPSECIEKGFTDPKECAEFMDNFRGPGGPEHFGGGKDCMQIEDKMERLDCFENAVGDMGNHYGVGGKFEGGEGEITWQCKENRIHWAPDCEKFMREEWPEQERKRMEKGDMRREQEGDWRVKEKECADKCVAEQKPWDYYGGECVCKDRDFEDYSGPGDDYHEGPSCDDCASQCPGASRTGCGPGGCECYYDGDEYNEPDYEEPEYSQGEGPGEPEVYTGPENTVEPPSEGDSGSSNVESEGESDGDSSDAEEGGDDGSNEGGRGFRASDFVVEVQSENNFKRDRELEIGSLDPKGKRLIWDET
ncbi:hypothetical protein ACFL0X_02975, partial [Nanoarchaeota archaeon]